MARVLLINPSMLEIYTVAKIKDSVPVYWPLNLLTVAAPVLENGHEVKILDLNFHHETMAEAVNKDLREFKPQFVGITFTTPLYSQSLRVISWVKDYDPNIVTIAGGVHVTSDCYDTLSNSKIDIGVIGEGDAKLLEIMESKDISQINGIGYKDQTGKVIMNDRDRFEYKLDLIPFPATSLIDKDKYKLPHTITRANPVFPLETSRGCVYDCSYCNKSIFGKTFRVKSPDRVIADLKKVVELGYKEVHIVDDMFTTNVKRCKEICRRIIEENIKLHINCCNGVRVDRLDDELLSLMKKAGIYRVSMGIESGSQRVLDVVDKDMTVEGYIKGVKMIKKAGIETLAYFMFGLPNEEESDMQATIDLAKQLQPDVAKFSVTTPLPSTPLFEDWKKKGYLLSTNWDDYGFYMEKKIYTHPNLSTEIINSYMNRAYRAFYFSPSYLVRRFFKSLANGNLISDFRMALRIDW